MKKADPSEADGPRYLYPNSGEFSIQTCDLGQLHITFGRNEFVTCDSEYLSWRAVMS